MSVNKFILCAFLFLNILSIGTKSNAKSNIAQRESAVSYCIPSDKSNKDTDLILDVYYKFVFSIDLGENDHPRDYFTANALKQLQKDYAFDCNDAPCYAYYALRTSNQDSNPDSDGESRIYKVELSEDGWYTVSYTDMGWNGKTKIKIVDGKIDVYKRLEP